MKTLALLSALLLSGFASAQDRPNVAAQPNTIFVSADGKFETAPDTAVIQFNINAQAETAKAAYEGAAKQAEQTREILRNNAIDTKAAQIGYYSLEPQYDWKNLKRKIVGYRVTTTVSLKLKDFAKIGPLTQQLADADLSTGQSVSYTLENIDDAKAKALADAYQHARHNAQALAQAGGRSLGDLNYGSVDTADNIRVIMPMARQMAAAPMGAQMSPPTEEFTPQMVTITAHVNAMFNLK